MAVCFTDKDSPQKILAISSTGMGNAILYTPVLSNLRRHWPESEITVLTGSSLAASVFEGSPDADNVLVFEKKKSSWLEKARFIRSLRGRRYDLVIASYLDRSVKVGIFAAATGAARRVGYSGGMQGIFYNCRAEESALDHEVENNLKLLVAAGVPVVSKEISYPISGNDSKMAGDFLAENGIGGEAPIAGIHPGSGQEKRWAPEKYAELCDMLAERYGADIMLLGSGDEVELCSRIAGLMNAGAVNSAGQLDIKSVAAVISKCSVLVANDTGLVHVASALGIPAVVIYGPTIESKNHPWMSRYAVVKKDMECRPCYSYGPVKCAHFDCLGLITVEEVFHEAIKMIEDPERR